MTKLKHTGVLKLAAVIIAVLMTHSGTFSESAPVWYAVSSNNTGIFSTVTLSDTASNPDAALQIECPEDISTYTDINECTADISNSLNVTVTAGMLASLTWKMTGATEGSSLKTGINQIDSYVFNEGTTAITYTAKDKFKNIITCTFTVIISDNQVPKLVSAPENITVIASENECGANVTWPEPEVVDNCTPSYQILKTSTHASGSFFSFGTTKVTYIIDDGMATTQVSYSFTVTVTDNTAPVLTAPEPLTINCDEKIPALYQSLQAFTEAGGTADDNCKIIPGSFKFARQTQSSTVCPYTLTRIYQVADTYGNIGKVEQLIYVGGPAPQPETETAVQEVVTLKSAMGIEAETSLYSTPGTYSFIVPAGVTSITVQAWGGGGCSGFNSGGRATGGGGGGAFTSGTITVVPGSTITVIVGAGGIYNNAATATDDGGTSSAGGIIANGGTRGVIGNNVVVNGGAGGTASANPGGVSGFISYAGGNGGNGYVSADHGGGGGGGGGASSTGAGNPGSNGTSGGIGGAGGTGNSGGGDGGRGADNSGTPNSATGISPGGGGGGRGDDNGNNRNGANGQVLITWDIPAGYCLGNAISQTNTGVNNPINSTGASDGLFATLNDNGDQLVLTLTSGDLLTNGGSVNVLWKRNSGTSGNPQTRVDISTDGTNWTTVNTYTVSSLTWITQTISLSINTRYIRFTETNDYDLDIDAVTYYTPCAPPCTPPAITAQPATPAATCSGSGTQTMSVTATGTGLSYSWRKGGVAVVNGGAISGQGTATLTLTNPTTADAGSYTVVVSGTCNPAVTSNAVTVTVNTAPVITAQPATPAATCSGSGTQTMSVTATGTGLSYSWRKGGVAVVNGGAISGQGTATLTLTNPTTADAGSYTVVVSGTCNPAVTSNAVTVTVNTAPAITAQPATPAATCSGSGTQTMSVTATGTGLSYSWRKGGVAVVNGGAISGQGTATLTLTNPTTADAGSYTVVVSGTCNPAVTSNAVTVTVNTAPAITAQPATPAATCSGSGTQTMSVTATGTGLSYSWRKGGVAVVNGGAISGQGTATLTLTNPTTADAGSYTVVVSGTCNPAVTSNAVTVTVNTAPAITAQPATPAATCSGSGTQTMSVTATGTGLSYSWRKGGVAVVNGGAISGQGTATLTLTNPTTADAGSYTVVVSGTCNPAVTSNAVTVTINTASAITAQPATPAATCSGSGTQTMSVTATGTGLSYSWRKGGVAVVNGGAVSGQGTATLTLTNPTTADAGSYTVVVSGTCNPAVTSNAVTVTVNTAPAITAQPATPAATCSGSGTQTMSVTATGTGLSYSWRKGGVAVVNGGAISGQGTATLTLTNPTTADAGSYTVVVSGTCNPAVTSNAVNVTVYDVLSATISGGTTPICYNTNPGTFTATGIGGTGVYTYLWYKDGVSTGITTNTYSPGNLTATSNFYCAVTSGTCGTVNTATTTITVNGNLTATISGGTTPICYNTNPGTFTATGMGGTGVYTYLWYKDGVSTGVTTNTYSPGNLTVTSNFYCAVTSGTCGTVNTATTTITVNGNLTATISGGTTPICYNTNPGTFTATGIGGTGVYTYLWYEDGVSTGVTTNTYSLGNLTASSNFYCAVTSGTCGTVNTATTTITVNGNLSATISGGTTPICYNTNPGTFTATGIGGTGVYTYLWYKDGVSTGVTTNNYSPGNLTATSNFYCAVTSGTCGTVNTATTTITVNGNLSATISGGTTPICYNTNPGTFTATGIGGTGVYTYLWYEDGVSTGVTTNNYSPGNLTATSNFYCAVTSGTCGTVNTATTTITVNGNLSATISGGTTPICYNTNPGTFTATGIGGTGVYTYLWYKDGVSTGVTTNNYSPGNLTATSNFYCAVTSGTCGTVNTATTTITVNGNLSATISGGTTPICYNTNPGTFTATGIGGTGVYTYLWYEDGVSTGVTTNTYSPGNLTATSNFYCAVTSGTCGTVNTPTTTITIIPQVDIPGSITGSFSKVPPATSGLVYSITAVSGATTYTWTVPAGWTITAGQGTTSITVTTGIAGQNGDITVIASNSCFASASSTLTVDVDTDLTIITEPADQTECFGNNAVFNVSISGGIAPFNYIWQRKRPSESSFTDISGDPDISYPSGGIMQVENAGSVSNPDLTEYRIIVAITADSVISDIATLFVDPTSDGGNVSADADVCTGSNGGTLTLNGHTGNILKWQSSTDNFVSNIVDISNTTIAQNYSNLTQTTSYRTVVKSGICPEANSAIATIRVMEGTLSPATQNVCQLTNNSAITLTGTYDQIIRWEKSSDAGANWTPIIKTDNPMTDIFDNYGTFLVRAVIANSDASVICYSETTEVIVDERATVTGYGGANAEICLGETIVNLNASPGTVTRWEYKYSATLPSDWQTLSWISIAGSSQNTYSPVPALAGYYKYHAIISNGSCVDVSTTDAAWYILVNALPTAPAAGDVTACFDGNVHTGSATLVDGDVIVWYNSATGGNVTSAPSGSAVGTYTAYAAAKITVTGCESSTRTLVTVTINNLPVAPTAGNVTACFDGNTHTGSATLVDGDVIVWYDAATGGNVISAPSGSTVGTYTAYAAAKITSSNCESSTRTPVTVTINALPTAPAAGNVTACFDGNAHTGSATLVDGDAIVWYDNATGGNVTSAPSGSAVGTYTAYAAAKITATGCESSTRTLVTVTINNLPAPPTAGNVTACFDGNTHTGSATLVDGDVIVWYNSATGGSVTSAPSGSAVGTYTAYAASKITATGCESSTRTLVTVTIYPIPNVIATPSSQNICSGFAPNIALTGAVTGTTFSWTFVQTGVTGATNGNGALINQPLSTTGTVTGTAIYTITPLANNCPGTPINVTITVYPTPKVTNPPRDTIYCRGVTTSAIPLTGTPTGVVFDITGGASIGLSNRTGVTAIPSFFASNAGTAIIVITPRANGCIGTPDTLIITVDPLPNVSVSPISQTICSGATTNINVGSGVSGARFSWTTTITPAGSVTGVVNITDSIIGKIAQTLTNTTGNPATVVYHISAENNGCTGATMNVTITVQPLIDLVITNPVNVCSPSTVNLTNPAIVAGSTSGLVYTYWTNPIATVSHPNPATSGAGTFYIKSTNPTTNCYVIKPVTVTVNPTPTVVITNPAPVCTPNTVDITNPVYRAGSTAGLTYTYWEDAAATIPYPTPTTAGDETYYIKGTTPEGCFDIKPLRVRVFTTLGTPEFADGSTSSACKGDPPRIYSATAENSFTLTYSLDAASLAAGNTINSATGLVTLHPNFSGTIVVTATATGCSAPSTAIHTITINEPPTVSLSATSTTTICEGESVDLKATSWGSSVNKTYSGTSGTVNLTIPNNSNASYSYSTINVTGSGGATLTTSDVVIVTLNITHTRDADLDIFLVDPTGTKAMLLSSDNGGNGDNYTNTVLRTDATNPITGGGAPFNNTFLPEGTISTAPDRTGATGGGDYTAVIPVASLNGAVIDGNWSLRIFDDQGGTQQSNNLGTLNDWSLSIIKFVGSGFVTTFNGPSHIGSVNYSGNLNSVATVTVTPTTAGTHTYTATTTDANGCKTTSNAITITVKETPDAFIAADYCSINGKIVLTALGGMVGSTYHWSTGESTEAIIVDEVSIYSVTITNPNGCAATDYLDVSNELVVNGDFEDGNTGFTSGYGFRPSWTYPALATTSANSSLWAENYYGIGTNGRYYHINFWGRQDHTSGTGNYLIVNGNINAGTTIWEEVVNVEPNINYYFSAWAMSLNSVGNDAVLQFEVNGTLVGTQARLPAGVSNDSNNGWVRFYSNPKWNSGSVSGPITIRIRNVEPAASGNDFGLDDISFGTLDPLPLEIQVLADDVCEGDSIKLYSNAEHGLQPITYSWTGPNGFTSSERNPVIPNATLANEGTYRLEATDGYGCDVVPDEVYVTINIAPTIDAGPDQTVCTANPVVYLNGVIGGSATSATWSGGTGTFAPHPDSLNASYALSLAETTEGTVTLFLTSDDPAGACTPVQDTIVITIHNSLEIASSFKMPFCFGGEDGTATATITTPGAPPYNYLWSDGQTTATATDLTAGTYWVQVTDNNGCVATDTFDLTEPEPFIIDGEPTVIAPSCYGAKDGMAIVIATGGTEPHTYLWDSAAGSQNNDTAFYLAAGNYDVFVTDSAGCAATIFTVTIPQPEEPWLICPPDAADTIIDNGCAMLVHSIGNPTAVGFCVSDTTYVLTGATSGSGTGLVNNLLFNVGITQVEYTITDTVGNTAFCSFEVKIAELTPPSITIDGCVDVSDFAAPNNCSKIPAALVDPVYTDNCWPVDSLDIAWTMTGATTGSGTGSVVGELFNVGVTTVTYTVTDPDGNTATCDFEVTIIDVTPPNLTINGCVDVSETADANNCSKIPVTIINPTYSDDCWPVDSLDITWTMTGATTGSGNGSVVGETFNVGVTTVTYLVTDPDGLTASCTFDVTILDVTPPNLTVNGCVDVSETADANNCSKIPVTIIDPTYSDDCWPVDSLDLTWTMTGATTGSGNGSVVGETFNVGVTTVTYLVTDPDGLTASCSFEVTIIDVTPPNLTINGCVDVQENAAPNNCSKIPVTILDPIYSDDCWPIDSLTLSWTMTGATTGSGTGSVVGETFNVGVTTVIYTVTDPHGNTATCDFTVTIIDVTPPNLTISGCLDVTDSAEENDCSKIPGTINNPTYTDDCWPVDSLTITWIMTGATTGSGSGSVVGEPFNIGVTTVTYTVTDPDGNSASCDFDVTIIHLNVPQPSFECPMDSVITTANAGNCDAAVTLDAPVITDLCNEIDSVWNNSPFQTSYSDASGTYPVGTTTFRWYITDISGNIDSCTVVVIVNDLLPTLTCPPDMVLQADFEQNYASNVNVPAPVFNDNCPDSTLTWQMTLPDLSVINSPTTGINIVPNPGTYNIGVTTIEYTFTDANGHVVVCDFTITVTAAPVIDCEPAIVTASDPGVCTATIDPGVPTLVEGVQPITWTWTITDPDGITVGATGTFLGSVGNPGPPPIPDYAFKLGTSTILWRAQNISGFDECTQTVTVEDKEPPTFTSAPITNCVDMLVSATYTTGTPQPFNRDNLIIYSNPDGYTFVAGNTTLDLTNLADNCCAPANLIINWRIDFAPTPDPDGPAGTWLNNGFITGTSQPSAYGSDMFFPGDGVTFQPVIHIITYTVTDCHGSTTLPLRTENITVTPRPELVKMN